MKQEFKDQITLSMLYKNTDGGSKFFKEGIDRLDDHIPEKYTEQSILDEINSMT